MTKKGSVIIIQIVIVEAYKIDRHISEQGTRHIADRGICLGHDTGPVTLHFAVGTSSRGH